MSPVDSFQTKVQMHFWVTLLCDNVMLLLTAQGSKLYQREKRHLELGGMSVTLYVYTHYMQTVQVGAIYHSCDTESKRNKYIIKDSTTHHRSASYITLILSFILASWVIALANGTIKPQGNFAMSKLSQIVYQVIEQLQRDVRTSLILLLRPVSEMPRLWIIMNRSQRQWNRYSSNRLLITRWFCLLEAERNTWPSPW